MQPFDLKFTAVLASFQTNGTPGRSILRYICNTDVQAAASTPFFTPARKSPPGIDVLFKTGLQYGCLASVH